MRARHVVLFALAVAAVSGVAWWLLDRQAPGVGTDGTNDFALPEFAAQAESVDRIEVRGAGGVALVVIEKQAGRWLMPDRDGWPANQREIGNALFRLGRAHRLEPKTANPKLYPRLGVEPLDTADAKGAELRLSAAGTELQRLLIGNNHPSLGGSYVRIGDEPQVWLLDQDIAPARDPADWLDRRLLDIPMARIESIRVSPVQGRAFALSRVDDKFSLDGKPPAVMNDPDDGNATAGFTDQLPLDDVAKDSGAEPSRTVVFEGLDGVRITVAAWSQDERTWARFEAALDEDKARAWFARPQAEVVPEAETEGATPPAPAKASPEQALIDLQAQVAAWQASFAGRQFLLPAYKSGPLMKSRDDYLAGSR